MKLRYNLLCGLAALGCVSAAIAAQNGGQPQAALPSAEQSYAADNGVSVQEARRRLDQMRDAGRLAAQLRASESETFGGMYVEHGPNFKIVALFTDDPAGKLKKYGAPQAVVGAVSKQSEKALREEQKEVVKALRDNGAEVASGTSVRTGEIILYTDDEAELNAAITKGNVKLGEKVKVTKVKSLKSKGEAAIYGGYDLKQGTASACTAGYAITNGSARYLSTAGHCPNTLNYNGSSLPFWFEWYAANNVYDFQVHSIGTNTVTNGIYVGTSTLQPINAVYPYASMYEGEYVCKYGQATRSTCGYVTDLNYNPLGAGGFVRVHRDGVNLSEGGDSGAPWYLSTYQEAWGIHSDAPFDNANDAFFMPASRFEDAGLRVLTTP